MNSNKTPPLSSMDSVTISSIDASITNTSCGDMPKQMSSTLPMSQKTTVTSFREQPMVASIQASKSCFSKIAGTYFDQELMALRKWTKASRSRMTSAEMGISSVKAKDIL